MNPNDKQIQVLLDLLFNKASSLSRMPLDLLSAAEDARQGLLKATSPSPELMADMERRRKEIVPFDESGGFPTPDFSMMLPTVGAGRLIGGARLRGPVKTWEKLTAVERAEVMKDFPKWTEEQLKTMELFTEYNDLLKRFGWAAKSRLRR